MRNITISSEITIKFLSLWSERIRYNSTLFYDFLGYTIRTETTVRTTEIKFFIGKTFSESTIDGRVTDTTPIRDGNVITLDQKGNPSRKEKDTKMIREFVRSKEASKDGPFDLMLLTMQVDDVICKRVYTRVNEDL